MSRTIELGTKVEEWYNGKKIGDYIVCKVHSFESRSDYKYGLMNINGTGIAYRYYNSLKELTEYIMRDRCWRIVNKNRVQE